MSRAEGGRAGAFKRCVTAGVKGVMDDQHGSSCRLQQDWFWEICACPVPVLGARVGLTAGKTAPDIYYQANTHGRYESSSCISHIASVYSLLGSVFKLKVRLHPSLKWHKAELSSEIISFIKLFFKKLNLQSCQSITFLPSPRQLNLAPCFRLSGAALQIPSTGEP